MSDISRPTLSALHQAFRNSFAALESNQRLWGSELAECSPLLGSLGNLAEQMRALSNVRVSSTPLGTFPKLEERLRFKLQEAADTVLEKLNEKMCRLQSARDAISNQVRSVMQLYEQNATSLDLQAVTERSAVTPSVADMLEWLQDAERHYRQQFLQRKVLLQTLRPNDLALLESLPERWKSLESPDGEQRITGNINCPKLETRAPPTLRCGTLVSCRNTLQSVIFPGAGVKTEEQNWNQNLLSRTEVNDADTERKTRDLKTLHQIVFIVY
uniref:AFG2 interacting ribosome maturation factor n=1 Tax=Oryzias latipes TaxID=8090 RepID=A0A3B3H7I8_ORYLA